MAQDEQMQPAPETKSAEGRPAKREKDPDTRALEKALEDVLGMVVSISHGARGAENCASNTRRWISWTRSAADCGIDHSPSRNLL